MNTDSYTNNPTPSLCGEGRGGISPFKVIIVEDVPLEMRGTIEILHSDVPEAEVAGTAANELEFWALMDKGLVPDLVLLDLGLQGSTTGGINICRRLHRRWPQVKVLVFTGEVLNQRLWVDVLAEGAHGVVLKEGELLTRREVEAVMSGQSPVFNQPILRRITDTFCELMAKESERQDAVIDYGIDEYDERFLRHLALGYTKEQISNLRGMPFGTKSLEKRQIDLISRLFPKSSGINATRLVTRAIQLRIIDIDNLVPDPA